MDNAVTIEQIKAEVENVPVEKLESLYRYVRTLSNSTPKKDSKRTFMEKMREIRIKGPADLSRNLDDYLYHGKKFE